MNSGQVNLKSCDDFSLCSDNSFCQHNQDQDTLCVEDIEDLLNFDDFNEENHPSIKHLNTEASINYVTCPLTTEIFDHDRTENASAKNIID